MLKLDLQLFSEDIESGTDYITEDAVENQLSESEQFEDLYYNGSADTEPDDDAVNLDSDEVAGGDTDQTDGSNQQMQVEQPWKNQQNAQFAAQRRRQEEAQRIQAARDAVYAEQFQGQMNPYTGQPIRTEADYRAYMQAYNADVLQNAGIQQEQFDQIVNADPRIQQAQQIIANQQRFQAQQKLELQRKQFEESLAEIKRFDKSVKGYEDIINDPKFAEIEEKYNRTGNLADAYKLVYMDRVVQQKQAAARQQVINQATGKQHMKATGQNGVGENVTVPPDVMNMYRAMNPTMSDEAIRKHYARTQKK